jgi:hypothetical protein
VLEIETYTNADIAQWDKEDQLSPAEKVAIMKKLAPGQP